METHLHTDTNEGLSKHRLEALTDGIFAFAMTLLVLDLKFPKIPEVDLTTGFLEHTLILMWPKFVVYFASFIQLGVFWIGQHTYFHFIKRTDRPFLWINIFFLMTVVLVPFSTDLLGDYPSHRLAVIIYGCNIILIGTGLFTQWAYATHHCRLVGNALEPEVVRMGLWRISRGILSYIVAIVLALVIPVAAIIIYVLVAVSYIFTSRIDHHWTHSHG